MDSPSADDVRGALAALIDPLARAARSVLLLDERQPDDLRAAALAMPAERLFWTLTQLDGGLDLDACQALVRAVRLVRGRRAARGGEDEEVAAAAAAARAAAGWLRRRWAAMAAAETAAWLANPVQDATAPAAIWAGATGPPAALPGPTVPSPAAAPTWLDLPPLIGPPAGADDPSFVDRLLAWLRIARR